MTVAFCKHLDMKAQRSIAGVVHTSLICPEHVVRICSWSHPSLDGEFHGGIRAGLTLQDRHMSQ